MAAHDTLDTLYILFAFLFQIVLIIHFALRRWSFSTALRYGPLVYALGVPLVAAGDIHATAVGRLRRSVYHRHDPEYLFPPACPPAAAGMIKVKVL